MRNAILFLVVLIGILQPTSSIANGVLDTKTTKNIHYEFEKTATPLPYDITRENLTIHFSKQHVTCKGQDDGQLIAQVSGGQAPYQYLWDTGATSKSIENLSANVYRITVTDANGLSKSNSTKITEPDQLIIRTDVSHVSCGATSDGRMEVFAEGGKGPFKYTWEIGGSSTLRENMPPGKYPVTVTDANGCTAFTCPELLAAQSPLISTSAEAPSCLGNGRDGKAFLTVVESTPPYYDIVWSTGDTQKEVVPNLTPGNYSVTVTNTASCSAVSTVIVPLAGHDLEVTVDADPFICGNGRNGTATVMVTGGSPPYQYEWSNGTRFSSISNILPGMYSVKVTDQKRCSKEVSFTIESESEPIVKVVVPGKVCFGENSSSITATVTEGVGPFTYEWNTRATTAELTNMPAGMYKVTVTGVNGCTAIGENRVLDFSEINFDYSTTAVTCPSGSDGHIETSTSGGTRNGFTYLWSNGNTTANLSNIPAGTYTVTITDRASKCTVVQDIIVAEPDPILIVTNATPASSEDIADGSASVQVTGGTPGYTYSWSNGATSSSIEGVSFGTYTVTVTDAAGCPTIATIIIEAQCVIQVKLFPTAITCKGNDGAIVADITRTNHEVTYEWSNGQTGRSLIGLSPGTYSVTISDAVGCTATDELTLVDNQIALGEDRSGENSSGSDNSGNNTTSNNSGVITSSSTFANGSSVVIQTIKCHGGSDGQITVTAQGGTGSDLTYSWSNGQTSTTATNLTAGIYTVSITDTATGCTITRDIAVTEPDPIIIQPTVVNASDETTANGSISVQISGGTAPYTYSWSNGATTSSIENLPFGPYTLTVTDANGCIETILVTIIPDCTIAVKLFPTPVSCKGGDGNIVADVSRTNEAVTYSWSNGQTGRSIIGLLPGTYHVTATDALGCVAINSVTVEDHQIYLGDSTSSIGGNTSGGNNTDHDPYTNTTGNIISSVTFDNDSFIEIRNVSCHGGANGQISVIARGGTGNGLTYTWSNGQTGQTTNNLPTGTYTVSITDAATGCIITRDITISAPTPIVIQPTVVNASDETTADGSASVQVTGGTAPYTYLWSNGATTSSIQNLPFGTYSVKVTDANGCMHEITIVVDPKCTIEVSLTPTSISCRGKDGAISATATRTDAAVTYAWSNGQAGQTIANLAAGNYTVTATDANGCIAVGSVTLVDNQIYLGDSTADGGDENASGDNNSGDNATGNNSGAITSSGTFENGSSVTIQSVKCHGGNDGQISINAQGGAGSGLSYSWNNGQTGSTINNLAAGTYTVSITDAATGCTITRDITISAPTPIVIQPTVVNASDEATADGSASVQVTGGTAPYTYTWSNGETTSSIQNIPFGTYTVKVTDANGCMHEITIVVDPKCTIEVSLTPTSISCRGKDGAISATATRTDAAVTYAWSNGQAGQTIANLAAGTYTVTATDANGCIAVGSVTLVDNQIYLGDSTADGGDENASGDNNSGDNATGNNSGAITSSGTFENGSSVTIQSVKCHGGNDGQISINAQGGTGSGLSYSWNNGQTGSTINNLAAGTYTVSITDAATGCTITRDIIITEPTPITVQTDITNATTETSTDGAINIRPSGGIPPYTYQWNTGANTPTLSNIPAGTYTVTITDANGCQTTETIIIAANCLLQAIVPSTPASCAGDDGTISFVISNASGRVTYNWSNGMTGQSISGLGVGFYSVTATDEKGCTIASGGFIDDGCTCIEPQINTIVVMEATGQQETDGYIDLSMKGGNNRFNYEWSNGATGATATNLSPNLYTVTISDRNEPACNLVRNIMVGNSTIKIGPVEITSIKDSECGLNNGSAELFPSGLTYQWSDGGTGSVRNNLAPGAYTVTATFAGLAGEEDIVEVVIKTVGGLEATVTVNQTPNCGTNNGSATITPTKGSGNYDYSWGSSNTRTDLTSGTYSVSITDRLYGCEDIVTFVITDNIPSVAIEEQNIQAVSCNGKSDGMAQFNIITTNEVAQPVTQRITDGLGNTFSPNNLPAGQYCLEVLDGNQCLAGGSCFEIIEPDELFVEISRTPATCSTNGIVIVKARGANGNFVFDWTDVPGSDNTPSRGSVEPGIYAIGVSDNKGCSTFIDNILIAEPKMPTVKLETTPPATLSSTDGSIQVITEGGLPPFRYLWSSDEEGTASIGNLPAGDYAVTVVDANGCVEILETTLEATCTFAITSTITNTSCKAEDGSIQLSVMGGTGTAKYIWSNGATSSTINNLSPGLYQVTITDEGACIYTNDFFIVNGCDCIDPIITNVVSVKETVPSSKDGSISIQVVADNPSYTWSDPNLSGNSVSGLSAGVYKITITDGDCKTEETIAVSNGNIPPIEIINSTDTPCGASIGSATLSPPNLTYSWNDGGTGNSRNDLAAGEYIITATDPTQPGVSIVVLVIETEGGLNALPVIDQLPDCGASNGQVRISTTGGSGNYSYSWGAGNSQGNLPSGTYSITVTDESLGCKEVVQFTLLDNVPAVEVTTVTTRVTCIGDTNGTVQVNLIPSAGANGPFTQRITDGSGKEYQNNNLPAGNYCVEVRDKDGCMAGSDCFTIMFPEPLMIEVTPTLSSCNDDGTLSLDIRGGNGTYLVNWADLNGSSNSVNRTELTAGTYSFEVTDRNGCKAAGAATIRKIQDPQLTISKTNAANLTSTDGAATANVSGGTAPFIYVWSNGATTQSVTNLPLGAYTVTVTDVNGCTTTASTEITADCLITIGEINFSQLPDCGASDGSVSIEVLNATNISFSWGPSNTRTDLTAGEYSITVTDNATGCTTVTAFELPNSPVVAKATINPLAICEGSTGTLIFNIERTACFEGPMDILIQDAQDNSYDVNNLPVGDFTLTVLDGNGTAISTEAFAVTSVSAFNVSPKVTPATCDGPGEITLEVEGGNDNYRFNWADIDGITNNANRLGIAADIYQVTITNTQTGCAQEQQYVVPNEGLDLTVKEMEFTCDGAPIQLSVENNKLSDNLVYNWSPASAIISGGNTGTPTVQVDNVQEFTYTVENQFGCEQSGTVMVSSATTQPPGMITQAQQCSGNLVTFKSSGGATDYYIWDFGDGTTSSEPNPSHEYTSPGDYQVTLRLDPNFPCADDLGMIANQLVEVKDSVRTQASFETDFEPCEDEGLVSFRSTSEVSPGPVNYFWNFGNGITSTEENPIIQLDQNVDLNISLKITTPFGCEDTARDNFEVEVFKKPTVFDTLQACSGVPTALNPTPAEGAFKYSWTPAEFLDNATTTNPSITVDKTTRVDVVIRDSVCETKSSVLVIVPDDPDYKLVEDMTICSSEDQVFFAEVEAVGDIVWSMQPTYTDTISTEPEFIAEPGIYHFRFTDQFGCVYEDEVEIANALIEAEIASDLGVTICPKDGATLTVINTKPQFEITAYEWMDGPGVLNTDFTSTSLVVQPDAATEYSVIITNQAGCMDTLSQIIEVSDIENEIMITASPDTIFISNSSVLEVTPPTQTVIWKDDATTDPTRTVTPMATTNYMVTLIDDSGCEATSMVQVVVENPVCAPPNIFFPNAFSPNGDGINDVLRLRGNGVEKAFWQVYNRWGQLVFEANSIDDTWDGMFEGKLVDPDVYGYILRVECFNGDVYETQGNVTVLR